jgi:hypothetical protein
MIHLIIHVNRGRGLGLGLVHQLLRVPMSLAATRVNGRFGEIALQLPATTPRSALGREYRTTQGARTGHPLRFAKG